jgi:hypothetical protein
VQDETEVFSYLEWTKIFIKKIFNVDRCSMSLNTVK